MTPTTLPPPAPRATLDDLMRYDGRAELIGGRVVPLMGNGLKPGRVADRICRSLDDHAEAHGGGEATSDGVIYAVDELPSGRKTFLPDAAYYAGPPLANDMGVVPGAPVFAAEVRSEGDTGLAKDREYAAKRADYFAAGTLVVWDVDPVAGTIDCYRAADPLAPARFSPGAAADAEPAVPGWRVRVDWLMRPGTNR